MSDTPQNPIDYFRLKASSAASPASVGNMTRAVDSLAGFLGGVECTFSSFDEALLGEWVARQFFDGYYSNTVAYNISKIAALYNKAVADGLASPSAAFPTVLAKVKSVASRFDGIDHSNTFPHLRKIYATDYPSGSSRQLARDIILFGIINGGLSLRRIADFKKDDYKGSNAIIENIVGRYAKPKNKYLFPLGQAHSTPKKLLLSIQTLIEPLLKPDGKPLGRMSDMVLADLWADIAMTCGISAAEIAVCVSQAAAFNALTFAASPAPISDNRTEEIKTLVADALTDNPVHWYAMHLRRHTEFKDLTSRLEEKRITLDELFYPMEEIFHKVGKRKVFETRPVISWLVFYRAHVSQLNRLFHEIGDLAWGYRYLRDVRSPYAVIPDMEVHEYQQAIGTLSPSTQILSDEEVKFHKGDCLVILGGPMNGRHGIFVAEKKEKGDPSGKVVFRISLAGGNNANWEVNWDSRLVRKITENQYRDLDRQFNDSLKATQDD